jgi:hypothetical protein
MTPRPGEKKAGNGVRLLGLSFPSEGPFFFLKADATTAALVQLNPHPSTSARLWLQVPHGAALESGLA